MNQFTKWAFKNKAAMTLFVIVILLIGVVSYFRLPMEFLPEADNPQVSVVTLGQGYDATTMATDITDPVENAVSTVKGKTVVMSTTGDGYSQVNINFDSKTKMKDAKAEVQDAISSLQLPDGVNKPNVVQLNTSMIPIAQVSLTFKDGLSKKDLDLTKNELVPLYQDQNGISQAQVYGENSPRVVIKLDKDKLAKKHLPVQAVMGVLQGQDLAVSIGQKPIDGKQSTIKVTGNLTNLDALKNLVIPTQIPNAPVIHLKDVASVQEESNQDVMTRINGKASIALVIFKEDNVSAVTAGKQIKDVTAKINKDYSNVQAKTLYTTADMVQNSVSSMMREVLLGALFATIVILLFLRRLRPTIVTVVSIPLSLAITLLLLWVSGITLNILTLGGVAVAVGRLVDDSIVVVENVYRRSQLNTLTKDNVLKATAEVSRAITASTLITVAVFLPIGLVSGSLRALILPFALTVTYSLLASLLVALTVVPLMSSGLLKGAKLPAHRKPLSYIKTLTWSLNHKFVPILLAILVLVGSIGLYIALPKGAISANNASLISVNMTFPADTPKSEVKQKMVDFESQMESWKGYDFIVSLLGNSDGAAKFGQVSDPNTGQFSVIMKKNADTQAFLNKINLEKRNYPGVDISASPASMMSASAGTAITYDLIGNNMNQLETSAKAIMAKVKGVDGVKKVSTNEDEKAPIYTFKVDSSNANTQSLALQLQTMISPTIIGTMTLNGSKTPVYLDAGVNPTSESDLKKLLVTTNQGIEPVSKVATVTEKEASSTVLHKDGKTFVRVSVEVNPDKLSVVAKDLTLKVNKVKLPKGVTLVNGGAEAQQSSDFADLGITMLVSILLVYLIMVITFRTLRAPLAILMTLPLASIGAVLGLLVFKVPADPTALIGGLMLIGIVVTNAIVLIDRVKQNEDNMIIRDAIIEACGTRLRPVVMTAVATVFAMMPLLFSHSEEGSLVSKALAVVVIGGLTVATVLTLIIVPVFYELLHFRKSKKQRSAGNQALSEKEAI
jgi:multidrug efflux pump subunit AcrB